jgi:predicted GNAT superfamily acetyltransferase
MSQVSIQLDSAEVQIRPCETVEEFDGCLDLQREVFGFPELEVSPRRHLVVSREAGGWTLGAFLGSEMVGFVHHLAAVRRREIIGYSHMMAVSQKVQNLGIGARLKFAQRDRALSEGVRFIRWTWDPMQARNAHFNLNRLGVVVRAYADNFYGTNYSVAGRYDGTGAGLDSDRLFAEWELDSERVQGIVEGRLAVPGTVEREIRIPPNWSTLVKDDPVTARREQLRVRQEFQQAFAGGLICTAFARDGAAPRYLLQRAGVAED